MGEEAAKKKAAEQTTEMLAPRLPSLLELCGADEAAMAPLAATEKPLLEHACYRFQEDPRAGVPAPPRALLPALRKALLQQPCLRTVEHLADCLLVLGRMSSEALAVALGLMRELHDSCQVRMSQRGSWRATDGVPANARAVHGDDWAKLQQRRPEGWPDLGDAPRAFEGKWVRARGCLLGPSGDSAGRPSCRRSEAALGP